MSIFHLTNDHDNPNNRQTIYIQSCDCSEGMKVAETMEVRDLFFDAKNGDKIELSSVLNKGTFGSVLKSNGDGTVQWGSDLTGGVNYTGSLPTAVNQLSLYNSTDGTTIKNSSLVEQDLLDTQAKANDNETNISNLQNDKLNRDGTNSMTGNLDMNNNNIEGCNILKVQELNSITPNYGIFVKNEDFGVFAEAGIVNPNLQQMFYISSNEPNYNPRMSLIYLNTTQTNISQSLSESKIECLNTELQMKTPSTKNITLSTGTKHFILDDTNSKVLCQDYDLDMNNKNITNVNNLQTQEIKATDGLGVQFKNNIEMQLNEIKGCKALDLFYNSDLASVGVGSGYLEVRGVNCNLLMYSGPNKDTTLGINDGSNNIQLNPNTLSADFNSLDVNLQNNNIYNCNEIKSDFIASSTTTEVKMNNDLNLNGKNIIGLELINGIQPSGGLYSESSGFSTASTSEINILGQGASSGSLSIPPNRFTALSMYSFKASGVLTGGTNDLFTLRAKSLTSIPSTVLLGEIMVTLQDNGLVDVPWDIMIDFTIRSTGIAGIASLILSGAFRYNNNNDVVRTFLRTIVLTTGFDTTLSNTLQLTFENDATNPLTNFRIDHAAFSKWY